MTTRPSGDSSPGLFSAPGAFGSGTGRERVAGYDVLRRLGRGSRCDVLLGSTQRDGATHPDGLVAVKILAADVPAASVDREADVLSRQLSPHVVDLVDLARAPEGELCLVLASALGGSAGSLITRREVDAAARITILVSALAGLGALHDAGVAHGSIRLDRVMIDTAGRPLLIGLGHAMSSAGISSRRAFEDILARDRHDFVEVCRALLADTASSSALAQLVGLRDASPSAFFERCESVLFDIADPAPVPVLRTAHDHELSAADAEPVADRNRIQRGDTAPLVVPFDWGRVERQVRDSASAGSREAGSADPALELLKSGFAAIGTQCRARLSEISRRRRRVGVMVLVAAVLLTVTVVVLIPPAASPAPAVEDAPSPQTTAADSLSAAADPATGSGAQTVAASADADPLRALPSLVAGRADVDPAEYSRSQILGGCAILTGPNPAERQPPPILLEKVGGGWRLRDVFSSVV